MHFVNFFFYSPTTICGFPGLLEFRFDLVEGEENIKRILRVEIILTVNDAKTRQLCY